MDSSEKDVSTPTPAEDGWYYGYATVYVNGPENKSKWNDFSTSKAAPSPTPLVNVLDLRSVGAPEEQGDDDPDEESEPDTDVTSKPGPNSIVTSTKFEGITVVVTAHASSVTPSEVADSKEHTTVRLTSIIPSVFVSTVPAVVTSTVLSVPSTTESSTALTKAGSIEPVTEGPSTTVLTTASNASLGNVTVGNEDPEVMNTAQRGMIVGIMFGIIFAGGLIGYGVYVLVRRLTRVRQARKAINFDPCMM